jgi:surface antigen
MVRMQGTILARSGTLPAAAVIAAFVMAVALAHAANPLRGSSFQLGEGDRALLETAARNLYTRDGIEVGATEKWENPQTGNSGTVTLIRKHAHQGMPCRLLQHDIVLTRTRDPYRFRVDRCRTENGEWKILAR